MAIRFSELSTQTLFRVLATGSQALTLIILARSVTFVEFGLYSSTVAVGSILSGFLGMGLATHALRLHSETSESRAKEYLTSALLISSLVFAGGISFGALLAGSRLTPWIFSAALYSSTELYVNVAQNLLFGEQKGMGAQLILLLRRVLPLGVLGISFWLHLDAFMALSLGYLLVAMLATALAGPFALGRVYLTRILRENRHYWNADFWAMTQQADVPLINSFVSATAAAGYAAAFRLASPVHLITGSLLAIYVPRLSAQKNAISRREMGRRLTRTAVVFMSLVILLSPSAYFAGPWLFGEEYSRYSILFVILTVNSGISVLNQLQTARLYGDGDARSVGRYTALCSLIGFSIALVGCVAGSVYLASAGTIANQTCLAILLSRKVR